MSKREREESLSHHSICVAVIGQPSDFQSSCVWNSSTVQMRYKVDTSITLADTKSPSFTKLSVTLDQSGYSMRCSFLITNRTAFMTTYGLHPASYTGFWAAEDSVLYLDLVSAFCYDAF